MKPEIIISSIAALLLCGCTQMEVIGDETNTPEPLTLKSSEMVIHYRVGESEKSRWTITPELNPDTLPVGCEEDTTTRIEFITDLESRKFEVSGVEGISFDIELTDGTLAKTAIQCVPPKRRYVGEYNATRPTAGDLRSDLSPIMDTYSPKDGPGSILAVWKSGVPLVEDVRGYVNVADEIERTPDHRFDLASISKEFTAIAIMQLMEAEKLSFDTPVSQFIPNLSGGDKITIRHLLNHTHGLPHYFQSEDYTQTDPLPLVRVAELLNAETPRFSPGTKLEYGNTGYFLLAKIGEMVSGMKYQNYIQQNVLDPAGMTETSFYYDLGAHTEPVPGYLESKGEFRLDGPNYHPSHMIGVADIVSTAEDLHRWNRAIADGTLMSKETFNLAAQQTVLPNGTMRARGIGFMVGEHDGREFIYNSGDFHTHTRYAYFPDEDLTIIFNTSLTVEYEWNQSSIVLAQLLGKYLNSQTIRIFDSDVDMNKL